MPRPHLQSETERVRKVRKDYDFSERNSRAAAIEEDRPKPLKHARSQAEITRVRQGWAVIALALCQLAGTVALVLHSIFHVL